MEPKPDRVATEFAYIRLLGNRNTGRVDFSRGHLHREPVFNLGPDRIREFLRRCLTVFVFANNRFQGHGIAAARALLAKVAGAASER